MNDDKELVSFEVAEQMLPKRDYVHTFRQAGPVLLGADYDRAQLLEAMRKAPEIQLTGPAAQAMKHGLAICDDVGLLFIATDA